MLAGRSGGLVDLIDVSGVWLLEDDEGDEGGERGAGGVGRVRVSGVIWRKKFDEEDVQN
jgi:hypothetical protein